MARVVLVDHPAAAMRLARLRDAATPVAAFRHALEELGAFLAYEATRALPTVAESVMTPVGPAGVRRIAPGAVVAPILRAGLGLLPGFLRVVEDATVAHLGFFRDPVTLAAVPYYANLPDDLTGRPVFVLDPMLATGNSAAAAMAVLAARGAGAIAVVCAIAAPEGLAHLADLFPDGVVVAAAVDAGLNDHGYIVPGLGDAGDRMFGSASSVPSDYRRPAPDSARENERAR
jgi:uracil phosphoribosyltransferase